MKTNVLSVLAIMACGLAVAGCDLLHDDGQNVIPFDPFTAVNRTHASLTARQQGVLNGMEAEPWIIETKLLRSKNASDLRNRPNLILRDALGKTLSFARKRIKIYGEDEFSWSGEAGQQGTQIRLLIYGYDVMGDLTVPHFSYRIEPLGDGLHALFRIDPSKYPSDIIVDGDDVEGDGGGRSDTP